MSGGRQSAASVPERSGALTGQNVAPLKQETITVPMSPASPQLVPTQDPRKRLAALIDELLCDASSRLSAREIVRRSRDARYPTNLSNTSISRYRAGKQIPIPEALDTLLAVLEVAAEVRLRARHLRELAAYPPAGIEHDHADRKDSTNSDPRLLSGSQSAGFFEAAPSVGDRPSRHRHARPVSAAAAIVLALLLGADMPPVPAPMPLGSADAVALAKANRARAEFYREANQIKLYDTRSDGYTTALDLRVDGRGQPPVHNPNSQYRNSPQGRVLNPPLTVDLDPYGPWTTLEFRACATQSAPSTGRCGPWNKVTSSR
ncbi:hypothetical protein ACQPYE_17785 [Actinosynnema sp. CA-299493]